MRRIRIYSAVLAVGGLVLSAGIAEARAKFRFSSPARAATPVKPAMAAQPSGGRVGTFVGVGIPLGRSSHAAPSNSTDTMSAAERLGALPTTAAATASTDAAAPGDAAPQSAVVSIRATPNTPAEPRIVSLAYPPRAVAMAAANSAQPPLYCERRVGGRCAPF